MSLNAIMSTANSGMQAAQTGLRVVSDNIANVNTAGYVRKTVSQSNLISNGMGVGVNIDAIKRATDRFLQSASLNSISDSSRATALADAMNNAQKLFGDPSGDNSFFSTLDSILSSFSAAADDPSNTLKRTQAMTRIDDFLGESSRITATLSSMGKDADDRISTDVDRVNDLLKRINGLNSDITRAQVAGADATGSENVQSGLIDELSTLMNIQVSPRGNGGVVVRSTEGLSLAGDGAAVVSYQKSGTANGFLQVIQANGSDTPVALKISSGELKGLMELRNTELPALTDQLGEFVSRASEELNRASNAASSVPAPTALNGRNTGLDETTALNHFTGKTTVAITDTAGVIQRRVEIDFDAGTMTVNGAAGPIFDNTDFIAQLNTALGGQGSASFNNGALSLTATGTNGVAVADDPTNPSNKAGKGFSHYFGLNDIIQSNGYSPYETGLTATDPNGFNAGGVINLRLTDVEGGLVRDVSVTVPSGGTMQDLLDSLNSRNGGVGVYGSFALDAKGQMNFTSFGGSSVSLSVVSDNTERGVDGPSITELFGVGPTERSTRGERFSVNTTMRQDPTRLPFAKLNLGAAAGTTSLSVGDGQGALGLAKAGDNNLKFSAAGGSAATTTSLLRYAADFGGLIARKAAAAESDRDSSASVALEVTTQRQSQEGVNLDEELINLTTYQQAFNASARLIQATKDMFDVLTNIV
jgi:flagellar hook-associated protein 1 FlgK